MARGADLRWTGFVLGLLVLLVLGVGASTQPETQPETQPSSLGVVATAPSPAGPTTTAVSLGPEPTTAPVFSSPGAKTVVIGLRGEIDDFNRDQLFRRFDTARKLGAKVVILDLDTYGGLVTAGLEISRFLKRQDDVHTIAFVRDKAISAGAMIAMACDEIVVGRSIELGDCAPIVYSVHGLEALPAAERAKMEGPIVVDFDESAARNHHDPLLAEAMVDVTRTVYWVQDPAGHRRFVDEQVYPTLKQSGWIDVPGAKVPIDSSATLLTVDHDQAIAYGLATGTASSAQALAGDRGFNLVADLTPGAGEKIVEFLSGAVVRGILLVVLLQCLYIVLHAPGHGVAETIGLVALALMLGVPLLTGYAQWWEILMIFVGLALISFEIILPGHIFPGVTGAILVFFGIVMTFVPKEPNGVPGILPHLQGTWVALEKGLIVVAAGMACSLFLWFWLNRYLPKLPYFNRLILTATSGGVANPTAWPAAAAAAAPTSPAALAAAGPAVVATWPRIGSLGKAVSDLRPGGTAEFFDESLADTRVTAVVSDSGYVPAGTEVTVREVGGGRIVVRRAV